MSNAFFDANFGAASPWLMNAMGTEKSITILLGNATILEDGDAILRNQQTVDEYDAGEETKRETMEVDVLLDDALSYKGLADNYTNAVCIVDNLRWSIEDVANLTGTWQRLTLTRRVARAKNASGRYGGRT